jgi:preprotein translocase subunit SecE
VKLSASPEISTQTFSERKKRANFMIGRVKGFLGEVKVELEKASWPWDPKEKGIKRYRELIDSTAVVVVAMLLLSGYIAFWDLVMVNLVKILVP